MSLLVHVPQDPVIPPASLRSWVVRCMRALSGGSAGSGLHGAKMLKLFGLAVLFFFSPLPSWCSFDFGRAVCMPTLWQGWRELQKQPAGCSVPEAAAGERLGPQQPVQGTFWEAQSPTSCGCVVLGMAEGQRAVGCFLKD